MDLYRAPPVTGNAEKAVAAGNEGTANGEDGAKTEENEPRRHGGEHNANIRRMAMKIGATRRPPIIFPPAKIVLALSERNRLADDCCFRTTRRFMFPKVILTSTQLKSVRHRIELLQTPSIVSSPYIIFGVDVVAVPFLPSYLSKTQNEKRTKSVTFTGSYVHMIIVSCVFRFI
jgi:hypothetical protein